jgi:hypothetical protein
MLADRSKSQASFGGDLAEAQLNLGKGNTNQHFCEYELVQIYENGTNKTLARSQMFSNATKSGFKQGENTATCKPLD